MQVTHSSSRVAVRSVRLFHAIRPITVPPGGALHRHRLCDLRGDEGPAGGRDQDLGLILPAGRHHWSASSPSPVGTIAGAEVMAGEGTCLAAHDRQISTGFACFLCGWMCKVTSGCTVRTSKSLAATCNNVFVGGEWDISYVAKSASFVVLRFACCTICPVQILKV